jgi:arylsulfatase A-like enzyme
MKFMTSVSADAGGSKPFFIYLPTNAPHGPLLVADKWKKPFRDQGLNNQLSSFKGMVANFDWNMGRLQKFLAEEQLADDTVLMFLTDNGTGGGAEFVDGGRIYGWPKVPVENANMRGGKSSAYDGGHRVPLFVRWPAGQLGQPRDVETLAAHFDITPTLMDLCGLDRPDSWPQLDGRSLAPYLRQQQVTWPERTLHTHTDARWKRLHQTRRSVGNRHSDDRTLASGGRKRIV